MKGKKNMMQRYREIQRQKAAGEREDGFTLIELLIVIVVLGILAAVVVFALGGVTSQSASSACNADAKTVETAVAAYQADGNSASALTTNGSSILTATSSAVTGSPFLQSWPSNPSHYVISLNSSNGGEVDVLAHGVTSGAINYNSESSTTGCNTANM